MFHFLRIPCSTSRIRCSTSSGIDVPLPPDSVFHFLRKVKFSAFDRLTTLTDESRRGELDANGIEESQWLSVLFSETGGQTAVRSGRGWNLNLGPHLRFGCLIGFHRAPPPNTSDRVIDAIRIEQPRAIYWHARLSIYWQ